MFLIRYGEIGLKRKNRREFENILAQNIRAALKKEGFDAELRIVRGRILVYADKDSLSVFSKIPGIVSYSPAEELEYADIKEYLKHELAKLAPTPRNFRVSAQRIDKSFPKKSPEINEEIGSFVVKNFGWKVNLKEPELNIGIEIIKSKAYVFFEKYAGIGGLPVGSAGPLLLLISPGMDSPVAGFMMLRRGAKITALYFSQGKIGEEKVKKYIEKLSEYTPKDIELHIIPHAGIFSEYREKLKAVKREEWTCIVCKYIMLKTASELAKERKLLGIVTGDSLGQVASQTLQNMYIESSGSKLPIYRPLIGMDKLDIERISKKIGTYKIYQSIKEEKCPFKPEHVLATANHEKFEEVAKLLSL